MPVNKAIWGSVYEKKTHPLVLKLIASGEQMQLDAMLLEDYLLETTAHVTMLGKQGIIKVSEAKKLTKTLGEIGKQAAKGIFRLDATLGDVHENVEHYLIQTLGEVGKKVHTGRSRNDQIETDTRLFLKRKVEEVLQQLKLLQAELVKFAKQHVETLMPGYTHLQVAQPMTVGFWMMSYCTALQRDRERLQENLKRISKSPLGAGASFGVTYPIDRELTAELMGFAAVEPNCLDAISNRGELVAETMWNLALVFTHLGKLANELILFSSAEFGFFTIGEEFTTGSSIMPQKRNQDALELIRAKSAVLIAESGKALNLMRNLPSGYNRDARETKVSLQYFDDCLLGLAVMTELVKTIQPNAAKMRESIDRGFALATDLADALVREKGLAFRDAHRVSGGLVKKALQQNKTLNELDTKEIASVLKELGMKTLAVTSIWIVKSTDPFEAIGRRSHTGGTAPSAVRKMIKEWERE